MAAGVCEAARNDREACTSTDTRTWTSQRALISRVNGVEPSSNSNVRACDITSSCSHMQLQRTVASSSTRSAISSSSAHSQGNSVNSFNNAGLIAAADGERLRWRTRWPLEAARGGWPKQRHSLADARWTNEHGTQTTPGRNLQLCIS
jgi:hypothetical protein